PEVFEDDRVEQLPALGGEVTVFVEDVAERPVLVEHPDVHGGDERVAADEVHLHREDAEEQVAVGGHGGARRMRGRSESVNRTYYEASPAVRNRCGWGWDSADHSDGGWSQYLFLACQIVLLRVTSLSGGARPHIAGAAICDVSVQINIYPEGFGSH